MSDMKPGTVGWIDLTVPDAAQARDFYAAVVGFTHSVVDMGEYEDFCMIPPASDSPTCGICHARGGNSDLPPVWMIYFIVEDLDQSLAACKERGGAVLSGPKSHGQARYAVIEDPAGAACALYQP